MKAFRILALAVALLGIVTVSISNAAALNVQARALTSFSGPAVCTGATLTVSSTNVSGGRTATLLISNVPTACRSQPMELTAYGPSGMVRATATTTTTGSGTTTSVDLDTSVRLNQISGIALTVGGLGITTAWAG